MFSQLKRNYWCTRDLFRKCVITAVSSLYSP